MYCALSGVVPEDPVISRISGHVFERRLILKALGVSGGKCPLTGKDLAENDLISVQPSGSIVCPLPSSATSIPGLLIHMRSEWDTVVLEVYKLKKALADTRQELAHSLYQYDAATRVIARLIKERDDAVNSLSALQASTAIRNRGADQDLQVILDDSHGTKAPASTSDDLNAPANGGIANSSDIQTADEHFALDTNVVNEGDTNSVRKDMPTSTDIEDVVPVRATEPSDQVHALSNEGTDGGDNAMNTKMDAENSEAMEGETPEVIIVEQEENGEVNQDPLTATKTKDVVMDDPDHIQSTSRKFSEDLIARIDTVQEALSSSRKSKKTFPDLAAVDDIREFSETHRCDPFKNCSQEVLSSSLITAMAHVTPWTEADHVRDPGTIVVGCGDGSIRSFSSEDLSIVGDAITSAHTGIINSLQYSGYTHAPLLFSGGQDGVIRIWPRAQLMTCEDESDDRSMHGSVAKRKRLNSPSLEPASPKRSVLSIGGTGDSGVSGLSIHPIGDLILSSTVSGCWRFHDVQHGTLVCCGTSRESVSIECCAVHPDGGIFGLGTADGIVEIWDVRKMHCVETLGAGHVPAGSARKICMSENGYIMIVCSENTIRVWDLRTLKITREAVITEFSGGSVGVGGHGPSSGYCLDLSGKYCAAVVGSTLALLETRKARNISSVNLVGRVSDMSALREEKRDIGGPWRRRGILWGTDARCLYVGTEDGLLLRYGKESGQPVIATSQDEPSARESNVIVV